MKAAIIPVTSFAQNCTLLWCPETMKGAVVDPGGDVERIVEAAGGQGVAVEKVLVTHGHVDHAGGAAELAERLSCPIEGPHRADGFLLQDIPGESLRFGLQPGRSFTPGRWLDHGDTVSFGALTLDVLHCPGHTPGHVVFFCAAERLALVGDVLFQGSIGRTDFPGSDHASLIRSITEVLWPLGDDVAFIPGHGPTSDFATERRTNPFVAEGIA